MQFSRIFFQDFPGPAFFKKKIHDFPGGVGTLFLCTAQFTWIVFGAAT